MQTIGYDETFGKVNDSKLSHVLCIYDQNVRGLPLAIHRHNQQNAIVLDGAAVGHKDRFPCIMQLGRVSYDVACNVTKAKVGLCNCTLELGFLLICLVQLRSNAIKVTIFPALPLFVVSWHLHSPNLTIDTT